MGNSSKDNETLADGRDSKTQELVPWCQWCGEYRKESHYCKEKRKAVMLLSVAMAVSLLVGIGLGLYVDGKFIELEEQGQKCLDDPLLYIKERSGMSCSCTRDYYLNRFNFSSISP
ncbi:MAG TPA: AtpZ/AtpI family protein [Candidatus Nanoarchaeia archaeon]|nr:AtpZ/AtpI family protein [Candidatus Nanoarchaeia archaeon]